MDELNNTQNSGVNKQQHNDMQDLESSVLPGFDDVQSQNAPVQSSNNASINSNQYQSSTNNGQFANQQNYMNNVQAPVQDPYMNNMQAPAQDPYMNNMQAPAQDPYMNNMQAPAQDPYMNNMQAPAQDPYMNNMQAPAQDPYMNNMQAPAQDPYMNNMQAPAQDDPYMNNMQAPVQDPYMNNMQAPASSPYNTTIQGQSNEQAQFDTYAQQKNVNPTSQSVYGSNVSFVDNVENPVNENVIGPNPIANAGFDGVQPVQMENFAYENQQNSSLNNDNYTNTDINNQQSPIDNSGFSTQQVNNFDEDASSQGDYNLEFVKAWMGDLYEKTHSKKFNWSAAILGPAYFLYRKLTLPGILTAVISFAVSAIATLLVSNAKDVSTILGVCGGASVVTLILAVIYGFVFYPVYRSFVRQQLNTYKKEVPDTNKLVNIAKQRGGTSMVGLVVYYVAFFVLSLILSTVAVSLGLNSVIGSAKTSTNTSNVVAEQSVDMQTYNFYPPYAVNYDANTWLLDDTSASLVYGAYTLKYANQNVSNIKALLGADTTTVDGRSTLLKTVVASFTQAAGASAQVEVGSSNFVMKNNSYYAYIDITTDSEIARYYLVLLPEQDTVFEFILSTNDTVIDTATNAKAIEVVSSVYNVNLTSTSSNTVGGSNTVNANSVSTNSVSANVTNATASNTVANTALSNSVTSTNTTNSNYVGVEVTNQTTTVNTINSSSDLDSLIIQ